MLILFDIIAAVAVPCRSPKKFPLTRGYQKLRGLFPQLDNGLGKYIQISADDKLS